MVTNPLLSLTLIQWRLGSNRQEPIQNLGSPNSCNLCPSYITPSKPEYLILNRGTLGLKNWWHIRGISANLLSTVP